MFYVYYMSTNIRVCFLSDNNAYLHMYMYSYHIRNYKTSAHPIVNIQYYPFIHTIYIGSNKYLFIHLIAWKMFINQYKKLTHYLWLLYIDDSALITIPSTRMWGASLDNWVYSILYKIKISLIKVTTITWYYKIIQIYLSVEMWCLISVLLWKFFVQFVFISMCFTCVFC